MTINDIQGGLAQGTLTARQVVDGYLARIEEGDGAIGAFLEVFAADARMQADDIDARIARGETVGALAGVPIAIKDNIAIHGKHTTGGSQILETYTAPYDATVIARLRAADAIVFGRTNCDEFACGSSTESSAWGVTKNPVDPTRVPGGSSGGSAAAVAAGFVPVALGSDTGGSIRQPAAMCGVVGFKPTYGAVSRSGLLAYASSFDQIGPLTTTVADAAAVMRVIAGPDSQDATTLPEGITFPELGGDVAGVRIGVPKQFFNDSLDPELAKRVQDAMQVFVVGGATIVPLDLPILDYALAMYYMTVTAELSSNLNRYDGLQYGAVTHGESVDAQVRATRTRGFGTEVKRRILLGTFVLSAGYVDAYYKKAVAGRQALRLALEDAWTQVDVIMGPTSPVVAWPLGEHMDDPVTMYLTDIYTVVANLAGLPGLSVPCGDVAGMPVGLQILGNRGADARVLALGHWYEQHR